MLHVGHMNMKWMCIVLAATVTVAGCAKPQESEAHRHERINAELKGMQPREMAALITQATGGKESSLEEVKEAVVTLPSGTKTTVEEMHRAAALGLRHPVDIIKSDYYKDGGTSALLLRGARGRTLEVSIDGRLDTQTPGWISLGTYYPDSENKAIPPDNAIGDELVQIIEAWFQQPLLAPVVEMLPSGRPNWKEFMQIRWKEPFVKYQEQLLENKKWPYEYPPRDLIDWVLCALERLEENRKANK